MMVRDRGTLNGTTFRGLNSDREGEGHCRDCLSHFPFSPRWQRRLPP